MTRATGRWILNRFGPRRTQAMLALGLTAAGAATALGVQQGGHLRSAATAALHGEHVADRLRSALDLRLTVLQALAAELSEGPAPAAAFERQARMLARAFWDCDEVSWRRPEPVPNSPLDANPEAPTWSERVVRPKNEGTADGAGASSPPHARWRMALMQPVGDGRLGTVSAVFRLDDILRALVPAAFSQDLVVRLMKVGPTPNPPVREETEPLLRRSIELLGESFELWVTPRDSDRSARALPLKLLLGSGLLGVAFSAMWGVPRSPAGLASSRVSKILPSKPLHPPAWAERSPHLTALLDERGQIRYLNPAGQSLLGAEATRSESRVSWWEADPGIRERVLQTDPWTGEARISTADGRRLPVILSAFTASTPEQTARWMVATELDRYLESSRSAPPAWRLEALGLMAAGVAHDFNNALSVLRAGLELLETLPAIPREAEEDLEMMRTAVASAESMTAELLAFSRPEARLRERFVVDEVLKTGARLLAPLLRGEIRLHCELAAGSHELRGDPGALQQVVFNLVLNARDALALGPGSITLRSHAQLDRVIVSVEDNGPGMSEHQRARAFDPFFTTKRPGRGTGLGLAMVKTVTEALGGHVVLESEEGRGTRIELDLPRA